jgi:hypothetical protein
MEKNQKILILVAWFAISYLILWFLGGACMSLFSPNTSTCIAKDAISGLKNIPIIGLLLPYTEWVSMLYWFSPIAGFIFAYFGIKWYNNYFETKEASSIIFLILILALLLGGHAINLFIYYNEAAAIQTNRSNGQVNYSVALCFETASECDETYQKINNELAQQNPPIKQYFPIPFWSELRQSIFLTFIFGAISAWLFLFGINQYEKILE